MPDFLVGAAQTYTTGQAAVDAVVAIGDLAGLGDHNIIIDDGYTITDLNLNSTQAKADGRLYIKSASGTAFYNLNLTTLVAPNGYTDIANWIARPQAGYGSTEVFKDSDSEFNLYHHGIITNPNGINTSGIRNSATYRDNRATDIICEDLLGSYKSAIVYMEQVERITVNNCTDGFNSNKNVIDCVAVNCTDDDFTGNTTLTNCASSDLTATGPGAVPSIVVATTFTDADTADISTIGDYSLVAGSSLIGGGTAGGNIGENQDPVPSAPLSTGNPSDGTVLEGDAGSTHSFVATFDGFPAPTYQWEVDVKGNGVFTNVAGATSATLVVSGTDIVFATDNGDRYRCKASNSEGADVLSGIAVLTILDSSAFSIVEVTPLVAGSQVTITINNGSVSGKTVSYGGVAVSVDSQSTTTMVIDSWPYLHKNISAETLDYGVSHDLVVTDGVDSVTQDLPTAPKAGDYYFVVTGPTWGADSILGNDVGVAVGDKVYAKIIVGSVDGISTDGIPDNPTNGTQIEYAIWDVTATATWGDLGVETINIPEAVNVAPSVIPPANLEIVFPAGDAGLPQSNSEFQGFLAGWAVFDDVTPGLTASADISALGTPILAGVYVITFTSTADAGGLVGTATSTLTITEAEPNVAPVVTPPADIEIFFATGGAGLSKSAAELVTWVGTASVADVDSLVASADLSAYVDPIPAGVYTITFSATDSGGLTGTATAQLTVTETAAPATAPSITLHPVNTTVQEGAGSATFSASASGSPEPTVQWQKDTRGNGVFTNIVGATLRTLTITGSSVSVFNNNGDRYRAVFANGTNPDATTTTATLIVTAVATGAILSGTLTDWDLAPYASQSNITISLRLTIDGPAIGNARTFNTDSNGNYSVNIPEAVVGTLYYVSKESADGAITSLQKQIAVA